MHVLFFIFTLFGKLWSLNTIILYTEFTKRPKEKSEFCNGLVSYRYRFVSIGIVLYRKKNKR